MARVVKIYPGTKYTTGLRYALATPWGILKGAYFRNELTLVRNYKGPYISLSPPGPGMRELHLLQAMGRERTGQPTLEDEELETRNRQTSTSDKERKNNQTEHENYDKKDTNETSSDEDIDNQDVTRKLTSHGLLEVKKELVEKQRARAQQDLEDDSNQETPLASEAAAVQDMHIKEGTESLTVNTNSNGAVIGNAKSMESTEFDETAWAQYVTQTHGENALRAIELAIQMSFPSLKRLDEYRDLSNVRKRYARIREEFLKELEPEIALSTIVYKLYEKNFHKKNETFPMGYYVQSRPLWRHMIDVDTKATKQISSLFKSIGCDEDVYEEDLSTFVDMVGVPLLLGILIRKDIHTSRQGSYKILYSERALNYGGFHLTCTMEQREELRKVQVSTSLVGSGLLETSSEDEE